MNQGTTVIVVGFNFQCKSLRAYLGHPEILSVSATAVTALEAAPFVLVHSKHNGLCRKLRSRFKKSSVQSVPNAEEASEWLKVLVSPTEPASPQKTTPKQPLNEELRRTLWQVECAMNGITQPFEHSYTGSSLGPMLRPATVHTTSQLDNLCNRIEANGPVVEFLLPSPSNSPKP